MQGNVRVKEVSQITRRGLVMDVQWHKSVRKQEPLGARMQTQLVGLQEEKKGEKVIAQEVLIKPAQTNPTHSCCLSLKTLKQTNLKWHNTCT